MMPSVYHPPLQYLSQANDVMSDVSQVIETRAISLDVGGTGTVSLRWVHRGRNAVTGASYTFTGCTFLSLEAGVVVEHRDFFDPAILVGQFKAAYIARKKNKAKSNM